ncbi:MAG: hypothetical protein QNL91_09595 [Candidatus Krumholzibacteria bacterium]|nr:hypothetical protein [Candidatus Krumholzibacteria bacterium]
MISAINSALQGLQQNQKSFAQHADRISRWGSQDLATTPPDEMINLQEELVGVLQSRQGYEANLPVIRAANEMLGTLLDTFA